VRAVTLNITLCMIIYIIIKKFKIKNNLNIFKKFLNMQRNVIINELKIDIFLFYNVDVKVKIYYIFLACIKINTQEI